MGWGNPSIWLLAALALLLVSVGVEDVRTREIANWKNAVIALLAPLWWWWQGLAFWPDMAVQVALATGVFAVFVGAFALNQMGGGDVKLIGALALWLPLVPLLDLLLAMSLIGGALTIAMMIEHRLRKSEGALEVPYGVAIAIAGLISLREPLFNHFA